MKTRAVYDKIFGVSMGGTDMKFKHIAAVIFAGLLVMSSLGFSAAAAGEDAQIGDVNRDGVIDIDDATLVQRIVAGTDDKQQDIEELRLSDAYGNSVCDISDVTAIQQYCADIIREQLRLGNTFAEHHKGHAIGAVSRSKGQRRHVYQRVHQSGISVHEHMTDGTRKCSVFCLY